MAHVLKTRVGSNKVLNKEPVCELTHRCARDPQSLDSPSVFFICLIFYDWPLLNQDLRCQVDWLHFGTSLGMHLIISLSIPLESFHKHQKCSFPNFPNIQIPVPRKIWKRWAWTDPVLPPNLPCDSVGRTHLFSEESRTRGRVQKQLYEPSVFTHWPSIQLLGSWHSSRS